MVQFHIQGLTTGPPISDQRGQVLRQKYFFGILILLVASSTITRLIYSQVVRKKPSPNSAANVANKPMSMPLDLEDSPPNSNFVPDDMPDFDNVQDAGGNLKSERIIKNAALGQMNMEKTINPEESVPHGDRATEWLPSTSPEFEGSTAEDVPEDEQLLETGLTTSFNDSQISTTPISTTSSANPTEGTSAFDVLDGTQT